MSDKIRAFIAVALPEPVLVRLKEIRRYMAARDLRLRWVRSGNIHLTLKFLGDVHRSDLDGVRTAMAHAADRHAPFSLFASGVGVFPNPRRARVLWAGIGGDVAALSSFHTTLDHRLAAVGVPRENRPFRGHLTIGRAKGRIDPETLTAAMDHWAGHESAPFLVERFRLFRSRLQPGGAVYETLADVLLAGGG